MPPRITPPQNRYKAGDRVRNREQVGYVSAGTPIWIDGGSPATVQEVDGIDVIVVFDHSPDVSLRLGSWEVRRAA